MSSDMRVKVFSLLLLAAVTVVGGGVATPATAQHVEVYVNGQRVTDVVINGGVSNGANGHLNGGARYVDSGNYVNGANGELDESAVFEDTDAHEYVNGAFGGGLIDGANGGNGLRRGFHGHSHIGPYDECFRDRVTGLGHCTGRHLGRHSGPHSGLYRGKDSAPLF
jgi:hypothetical protein